MAAMQHSCNVMCMELQREGCCSATHPTCEASLADAWRHHSWQHPRHHAAWPQGCTGFSPSRAPANQAVEGGTVSKHADGGTADSRGGSGGGGTGGGGAVSDTLLLRCVTPTCTTRTAIEGHIGVLAAALAACRFMPKWQEGRTCTAALPTLPALHHVLCKCTNSNSLATAV